MPAISNFATFHCLVTSSPKPPNNERPLFNPSDTVSNILTPLAPATNKEVSAATATLTGAGIAVNDSKSNFNPFNPVLNTGKVILPTSIFSSDAAALVCSNCLV